MWENLPSAEAIAASVVVFCTAVGAAVLGALQAAKKIKDGWVDAFGQPDKSGETKHVTTETAIFGGVMQDVYGSKPMVNELSALQVAIAELKHAIDHNTKAVEDSKDATCAQREETRELRHQVERLTDRLIMRGS